MLLIVLIVCLAAAISVSLLTWVHGQRTIQHLAGQLQEQQQRADNLQRRFELMFDANPYCMWTFDRRSLRFLAVNDTAVKAYGYSREEFLSMTLADIRPEEDVSALLQVTSQENVGYSKAGVWRHRRKDGSIIFVEIMSFGFDAEDVAEEMVLALDVTEAQQTQAALLESQTLLKTLIEKAPLGVAQALMGEDHLRSANPTLLQMLGGYSSEEALQLSVSTQIYADPKERDRLLDVVQRNGQIQGWETNLRTRSSTLIPVRVSGSITGGKDGSPQIFSSYIEDLTQQSKLEQQVRQVQKLEAVGRLAGGMAHDFNNILVVIKLSAEIMLSQVTPGSPFSKPLLQITDATDRAAALVRQMLAFSRQQVLQPRVLNLNTVVSETTQMLRRVIGEDIELVAQLADGLDNCCLDPDQVTQVILNLAVNARDAMPDGGVLQMETSNVDLDENYAQQHPAVQPGRYVMLAVTDNGTGIEKSLHSRIFDPFFTTKELGKGTGLGLSIVYGIVKQSGGYIWVYSEPGYGTTFKLYFPVTQAPIQRMPQRTDIEPRAAGETILLVDDEPSIRGNVRGCLEQMGYKVLEAEDGLAALQLCEKLHNDVDLVITDLVMAVKNGRELASELAERFPQIHVLFMSGYSEGAASQRDILLRGRPFLQKPFSVADLAKAAREALRYTPAEVS